MTLAAEGARRGGPPPEPFSQHEENGVSVVDDPADMEAMGPTEKQGETNTTAAADKALMPDFPDGGMRGKSAIKNEGRLPQRATQEQRLG